MQKHIKNKISLLKISYLCKVLHKLCTKKTQQPVDFNNLIYACEENEACATVLNNLSIIR